MNQAGKVANSQRYSVNDANPIVQISAIVFVLIISYVLWIGLSSLWKDMPQVISILCIGVLIFTMIGMVFLSIHSFITTLKTSCYQGVLQSIVKTEISDDKTMLFVIGDKSFHYRKAFDTNMLSAYRGRLVKVYYINKDILLSIEPATPNDN